MLQCVFENRSSACAISTYPDGLTMERPPLDPPVADTAPTDRILTGYDEQHMVTYLRLLDAEAEGADWRQVAKLVLHLDPAREPVRARRAWETHLARARWMRKTALVTCSAAARPIDRSRMQRHAAAYSPPTAATTSCSETISVIGLAGASRKPQLS
jgi:hypothetical protein